MTREEKVIKRKLRAEKRKDRRNESYIQKVRVISEYSGAPMSVLEKTNTGGYYMGNSPWEDSDSKTGYTQKCQYWATCDYPCDGSC